MDTLNNLLTSMTDSLGKLYGLPGYVLILIWCIVFGYGLRKIKRFPNDAIPLAIILWGCIWNSVIADPKSDLLPLRIWVTKNIIVGAVVGFTAWLIHKKGLSYLENWVAKHIPFLGWLVADEDKADNPPKSG